jgi:hypothetical protein
MESTARRLENETGLTYRPAVDGQRVSGVLRRAVQLTSGRFAMLDDATGFSLVPWRPILLVGLGMVLFYMVDTAAQTWGPTYLDQTFDTPEQLVCATCGRTAPAEGEALLTWARGVELGRDVWTCDVCSRQYLRSIEGKLDSDWW